MKPQIIPSSTITPERFVPDKQGDDRLVSFLLLAPSSLDRDRLNTRLVELGLESVSQEMVRATMIDDLFDVDWEKGSDDANLVHAEELANFLDGIWQQAEIHDAAVQLYHEQEVERLMDEAAGAPSRAPTMKPKPLISVRDNARQRLIVERMMNRPRLRKIAGANQDFQRQHNLLLVRMQLLSYTVEQGGVQTLMEPPRGPDGTISEADANEIREELSDTLWSELVMHIRQMYGISQVERKNSDSPPEKPSDQNGSHERSGDTADSDGNSTTSSIGAPPSDASDQTTEPPSSSTSDAGTGRASKARRSRTVAA